MSSYKSLSRLHSAFKRPGLANADDLISEIRKLQRANVSIPFKYYLEALRLFTFRKDMLRTELLLRISRNDLSIDGEFTGGMLPSSTTTSEKEKNRSSLYTSNLSRSVSYHDKYNKLVSYAISSLMQKGCYEESMTLWMRMTSNGFTTNRISLFKLIDKLSISRTPPSLQLLDDLHKVIYYHRWEEDPLFDILTLKVLRHHILWTAKLTSRRNRPPTSTHPHNHRNQINSTNGYTKPYHSDSASDLDSTLSDALRRVETAYKHSAAKNRRGSKNSVEMEALRLQCYVSMYLINTASKSLPDQNSTSNVENDHSGMNAEQETLDGSVSQSGVSLQHVAAICSEFIQNLPSLEDSENGGDNGGIHANIQSIIDEYVNAASRNYDDSDDKHRTYAAMGIGPGHSDGDEAELLLEEDGSEDVLTGWLDKVTETLDGSVSQSRSTSFAYGTHRGLIRGALHSSLITLVLHGHIEEALSLLKGYTAKVQLNTTSGGNGDERVQGDDMSYSPTHYESSSGKGMRAQEYLPLLLSTRKGPNRMRGHTSPYASSSADKDDNGLQSERLLVRNVRDLPSLSVIRSSLYHKHDAEWLQLLMLDMTEALAMYTQSPLYAERRDKSVAHVGGSGSHVDGGTDGILPPIDYFTAQCASLSSFSTEHNIPLSSIYHAKLIECLGTYIYPLRQWQAFVKLSLDIIDTRDGVETETNISINDNRSGSADNGSEIAMLYDSIIHSLSTYTVHSQQETSDDGHTIDDGHEHQLLAIEKARSLLREIKLKHSHTDKDSGRNEVEIALPLPTSYSSLIYGSISMVEDAYWHKEHLRQRMVREKEKERMMTGVEMDGRGNAVSTSHNDDNTRDYECTKWKHISAIDTRGRDNLDSLLQEAHALKDPLYAHNLSLIQARLYGHARLSQGYEALKLLRQLRLHSSIRTTLTSTGATRTHNTDYGLQRKVYIWITQALYYAIPTTSQEWNIAKNPVTVCEYLLREMQRDGLQADESMVNLLLKLYNKAAHIASRGEGDSIEACELLIEKAEEFLIKSVAGGYLGHQKIAVTSSLIKQLVVGCCLCELEDKAFEIVKNCDSKYKIEVTADIYEPIIYYYAVIKGNLVQAEDVLQLMVNKNITPNSACVDSFVKGLLDVTTSSSTHSHDQEDDIHDDINGHVSMASESRDVYDDGDEYNALEKILELYHAYNALPARSSLDLLKERAVMKGDEYEIQRIEDTIQRLFP